MNVDKTTAPNYFNLWMSDNEEFLNVLREEYKNNVSDEDAENDPRMVLCDMDRFSISAEELYLEENRTTGETEIYCSFVMNGKGGDASISISIPLSDLLLIDILQHGIKKLNKLKTAMEALK